MGGVFSPSCRNKPASWLTIEVTFFEYPTEEQGMINDEVFILFLISTFKF